MTVSRALLSLILTFFYGPFSMPITYYPVNRTSFRYPQGTYQTPGAVLYSLYWTTATCNSNQSDLLLTSSFHPFLISSCITGPPADSTQPTKVQGRHGLSSHDTQGGRRTFRVIFCCFLHWFKVSGSFLIHRTLSGYERETYLTGVFQLPSRCVLTISLLDCTRESLPL